MGGMKFTIRDLLWLTVVAALIVALLYVKRPVATGRFQLVVDGGRTKYVMDTTSGKIWWWGAQTNGEWVEYSSPPNLPK
jgi:hypothetical protein